VSRAARLEPLAEYASQLENDAARRLAASLQALRAKEAELDQLRSYLAEYRQRVALDERSTDVARWQNGRAFLERLGAAVTRQEAELQRAIERHRLDVERWRASRQRSRTLDNVIERAESEARLAADRRAQAELDEVAARFVTQSRS
jgi:flagellar export protein FliJ